MLRSVLILYQLRHSVASGVLHSGFHASCQFSHRRGPSFFDSASNFTETSRRQVNEAASLASCIAYEAAEPRRSLGERGQRSRPARSDVTPPIARRKYGRSLETINGEEAWGMHKTDFKLLPRLFKARATMSASVEAICGHHDQTPHGQDRPTERRRWNVLSDSLTASLIKTRHKRCLCAACVRTPSIRAEC